MLIERIGIVGAGTIGAGVAYVCAQHGFEAVVYDRDPEASQKCLVIAQRLSEADVNGGSISPEQRKELLSRIVIADGLAGLSECPLVIEAVTEDESEKISVFRALDAILAPDAILCSTTSSIPITVLGRATNRPELVAGMHFFAPVLRTKLIEVVRGLDTSTITMTFVRDICIDIGRLGIQARKDTPGYIVNRIKAAQLREAVKIAQEEIAPAGEIDLAVKMILGSSMGPFELSDLSGVDESLKLMEALRDQLGSDYEPPLLLRRMVEAGRLGRKTGRGWHEYEK